MLLYLPGEIAQFVGDLAHAHRGQPLQPQIEDRPRLDLAEVVGAVLVGDMGRIVDQRDVLGDLLGGPAPLHEQGAGLRRVGRAADGGDDLVDVGHRDGESAQHVAALAGAAQLEGGAPRHHLLAERHEGLEEAAQRQRLGPPAVEGQHVAAEEGLHRREAVELVERHLGGGVALELDDDAHAVAVGFVLDVGDPVDALVAGGLGDPLDHGRLVDLVGDLVDDDGVAVLAQFLDMGPGAQDHASAALDIGLPGARAPEHDAAGGEVGAGDELHQRGAVEVGILDQGQRRVDHLAEIVRRDVGGHADGDAAGAVDQHVREPRRKHRGLLVLAVVVVLEVDGVLLDVLEQELRRGVHAHLGVAHRRGVVAVHRAEIALTVEQRQRHREVLRHAHQRVVDGGVAMRVVLAHDVPDRPRRLAVRLVAGVAGFVHRVENPAVHRLEPVAQIRNRPADDHAHRVAEIGGLHLLRDGHVRAVMLRRTRSADVFLGGRFWGLRHVIFPCQDAPSCGCALPIPAGLRAQGRRGGFIALSARAGPPARRAESPVERRPRRQ